jgi:flagellar biosynthesis protein FlhF
MTADSPYEQHPDAQSFSGTSLEEVLPQIRATLGADAVILDRRDGVEGGVAGFFGRRSIVVDACAARPRLDVRDEDQDAEPGESAPAPVPYGLDSYAATALPAAAPVAAEPTAAEPGAPAAGPGEAFAQQLAGLLADRPIPPAPAHQPVVDHRVHAAPTLDDADALVAPSDPVPATRANAAPATVTAAGLGRDGAALLATGISHALAAELVHTAAAHVAPLAEDDSPRAMLRAALAARIPVATPVRGPGGAVIGFVGPAGAGKTRCVARLATAYAKRSALPVACVTLRPVDEGAELEALLQAAGVPVHVEHDAVAAARRIGALRNETIVLLDTPGVSPRAQAELRTLSAELRRLAADELHLTVPATIGPLAARELVTAGRALGAGGIALTHADETEALGTVVELAMDTGLPLSYVARGTALDGGMRPAAADALALALLAPLSHADELL